MQMNSCGTSDPRRAAELRLTRLYRKPMPSCAYCSISSKLRRLPQRKSPTKTPPDAELLRNPRP